MGRQRNGNWTETGWVQRQSGSSPKDTREAMWEAYIRYESNKHQLTISMAGWSMTDEEVEPWCNWFRSYLERLPSGGRRGDVIWAHEVNFAENRLTSAGVRCLLETLIKGKVAVLVLKLHHNQMRDGRCVADFILNNDGALRELHLSHNELDSAAAAEIVLAAARACDSLGNYSYPSHSGHSAAPLWLRLEQNYVEPGAMASFTDPEFEKFRLGKVLCNVSSRACTPHCCVKHRHDPPPVHAKHLSNQRSKPSQESPASQDILTMLKTGKKEDEGEQPGDRSPTETDPQLDPTKSKEGQDDASSPRGEFADVLRWDEDQGTWVRDVIEIVGIATKQASEETGRVKLTKEVGNKWGDAIKNMLGGLKRPEGKLNGESVQSSPAGHNRFSKLKLGSPSNEGRDSGSTEHGTSTPKRSLVADDELMYKSPLSTNTTSRRSRRGAQPFGSEVKQVNGSGLNPQAKEFFPTLSPQQKVHELSLQAVLNPEAEEFSPQTPVREKSSKALASKSLPPFPNFSNTTDSPTPKPPNGSHKNQKIVAATKESKDVSQIEVEVEKSADIVDASVPATRIGTSASTSNPSSSSSNSRDNLTSSSNMGELTESIAGQVKVTENSDSSCIDEGEWSIGKAFFSAFSAASAAVGLGPSMSGSKTQRSK